MIDLADLMLSPEENERIRIEARIEARARELEQQERRERENRHSLELESLRQQRHKEMLIEVQVEAMRRHEAEKQPQTETLADVGAGNTAVTEPASVNDIKPTTNEVEFSGLLNIPSKKDDWFEVIDEMTKNYFNEHRTMPTKAKAWAALWTNPPDDYKITTHEDKNDSYLTMPATKKPLSRTNFMDRWENYTEKKTE